MSHFIFLPYLLSASWNAVPSNISLWVSNSFFTTNDLPARPIFIGLSNWCSLSNILMLCWARWGKGWLGHYIYCCYWTFVAWIQSGYIISTQISDVSQNVHWICSTIYDYVISMSHSSQGYPGSISTFLQSFNPHSHLVEFKEQSKLWHTPQTTAISISSLLDKWFISVPPSQLTNTQCADA